MICFYIYRYMCYVCCDHSQLTDFWIYGMQLVCMTAQLYFCCKHMAVFLPVTTRALEYYDIKVLECVTRQFMTSNSFISVTEPVWSWHCFHKVWTWQSVLAVSTLSHEKIQIL